MRKVKPGIVRTTLDLAAEVAHLADAITKDANLDSRKETIERSIKHYGQVVDALKQGLKVVVINAKGAKVELPLEVPVVEQRTSERLMVARINARDVARLVVANTPHHPAANVVLRLAMAASHPKGPQPFAATLLFQFIYLALRLQDDELLALARNVVTSCATNYDSFAHLLQDDGPSFDLNHVEQQFLSDEYLQAKRKQLPG